MTAATYAYDPWGNTTTSTGALATTNPWHYASSYTATGYLKLGARYYNPTTARFTQPDPAHTCGGYAYAGDDPANNTDPTGRSCVAAGLAGGAVGFVVGAVAASPADIPTVGLASVAVGIDVGINTGLATYISCELAGLLSSWGL
jgi:RHS repeat-associated protein